MWDNHSNMIHNSTQGRTMCHNSLDLPLHTQALAQQLPEFAQTYNLLPVNGQLVLNFSFSSYQKPIIFHQQLPMIIHIPMLITLTIKPTFHQVFTDT